MSNQNGQFNQTDFMDNTGGTNLSDSVFKIKDTQAAGGFNFDYVLTGGVRTRLGPTKINSVANADLRTLGFGLYNTSDGIKSVIRAAGQNLQLFDTGTPSFTVLTSDAIGATPLIFDSGTTTDVQFSQFNNGSTNILWAAGGGTNVPVGVVSTTQYTQNGVQAPSGAITASVAGGNGVFPAIGAYTYAISYRKKSTQAQSNVTLDVIATLANTTDHVTLNFSALTGLDTTLIDEIYVWRSGLADGAGFTTGDLIAQLPSGTQTYTDFYSYIATAQNVPRAGNTLLDNSTLPTNTFVKAPTGFLVTSITHVSTGEFQAIGSYKYAIAYQDKQTLNLSVVALDVNATITDVSDTVTIDFTNLTGLTPATVAGIYLYRSPVGGSVGFLLGDFIAQLGSDVKTYTDMGLSIASGQTVNRTPSSESPYTFSTLGLFKRKLVTTQGSTVYISDLNKSESWPLTNIITVPSAGDIKALATISFTSPQAQSLDEILVIYKEREMWVITGNDFTDFSLKFIDQVGCANQSLVILANGFLSWIDYRGIYLWDGTSKPIYCSRLLEPLFAKDGDLDKSRLRLGHGEFFRKENQIIWFLSSRTFGEQVFSIKMDLRLTLPQIEQTLTGRNIDATLIQDTYAFPVYAAMSYIPSNGAEEMMVMGDASGFCYFAANGYSDGGSNYSFTYKTKPLNMGDPNTIKQFHKVIVWVQDIGNWNLTLDYWANYRTTDDYKSTQVLPVSTEANSASLWDIAVWDVSFWDSYTANVIPIVFNLQSGVSNSSQGSALQLQFRNDNANQPITIHGFSVIWSSLGGLTQ